MREIAIPISRASVFAILWMLIFTGDGAVPDRSNNNDVNPFAGCKVPVTVVVWLEPNADPQDIAERNAYHLVGPVGPGTPDAYEYIVGCADELMAEGSYLLFAITFILNDAKERRWTEPRRDSRPH